MLATINDYFIHCGQGVMLLFMKIQTILGLKHGWKTLAHLHNERMLQMITLRIISEREREREVYEMIYFYGI